MGWLGCNLIFGLEGNRTHTSIHAAALLASASLAIAMRGHALTQPKPATRATIKARQRAAAELPEDGTRDQDFATRGFLGTREDPIIRNANGQVVRNLGAYDFVEGAVPLTVHLSLWRHMRYLKHHGLFQLTGNVWQVRGFDLAKMMVIRGDTGWILIDRLTTKETAGAALDPMPSSFPIVTP